MPSARFASIAALSLAVVAFVGCSSYADEGSASNQDMVSTSFRPGEFKLYPDVNHAANPSCDVFIALSLVNTPEGPKAKLENRVLGLCPVAVSPEPREYLLRVELGACGDRTYKGGSDVPTGPHNAITLADHRLATCMDVSSALVAEETRGTSTKTFFAIEVQAPPAPRPLGPCATAECRPGTVCDDSSGHVECKTDMCLAIECAAQHVCINRNGKAECVSTVEGK